MEALRPRSGEVLPEDADRRCGLPPGNGPRLTCTKYCFVVHIWKKDGTKISAKAVNHACLDLADSSRIRLYLGRTRSSLREQVCAGEFQALEIEVCCVMNPGSTNGPVSAVLYSSANNQLRAYGGRSFEEYSAVSWFEWQGGSKPYRWDWLPFVKVILPSGAANRTKCLCIEMQWHSRISGFQRGDEYKLSYR